MRLVSVECFDNQHGDIVMLRLAAAELLKLKQNGSAEVCGA